jgi:hypothetical protein
MSKNYRCDICNYNAITQFGYKKHLATKKHLNMIPGLLSADKCILINDDDPTKFKCYYCKKQLKYNNYRYTHIKKCKEKYNTLSLKQTETPNDIIVPENILPENTIAPITPVTPIDNVLEYIKQSNIDKEQLLLVLAKLFGDIAPKSDVLTQTQPVIQIINNNNITNINSNNSNNNDNRINFNYVKQNYKNPKTIEECLALPLTDVEKFNITKATPIVGCEYLIKNRCITGLELDERPVHSIDESRDKFAVYTENENNTKNWVTQSGSDITKIFMPIVRKEYEKQYKNPTCDHAKIAEGISYMYMDGNRKIVKSIAKLTNLKNNLAKMAKLTKSKSESDNQEDVNVDNQDSEDLRCKYNFIDSNSDSYSYSDNDSHSDSDNYSDNDNE